jgi:isocitrate lyase
VRAHAQSSSTASTTNEPGPDLADYPYTTVPNKVDQLFRAQVRWRARHVRARTPIPGSSARAQDFHARKQREDRSWMAPAMRERTPL